MVSVEEKRKKRKKIAEKYNPLIADLETQIAKIRAEIMREKQRLQALINSGMRPTKLEIGELARMEAGIPPRQMKMTHYKNEKRIEELAVDLNTTKEKINDALYKIAEELQYSIESEAERAKIIQIYEQRMGLTAVATGPTQSTTLATDEDLKAVGLDIPGTGKEKMKGSKRKEKTESATERESTFE